MKTMCFRISDDDHTALRRASKAFGLSIGDIVRRAIRTHGDAADAEKSETTYKGPVLKAKVQDWATGEIARNAVRARLRAEGCHDADFPGDAESGQNPHISDDDKRVLEDGEEYQRRLWWGAT